MSKDEQTQKKQTIKEQTLKIQNQYLRVREQRILIFSLVAFILFATAMVILFLRQKNTQQNYEKVLLEQQLLRSQMNPHFIFNAISVIQFLIKNKHNADADKYLSKFSRLLRKSLENSTEQFAPIQDEIKLLEDYLVLQKLRFTNEFEYKISVYEDFEDNYTLIPPMLIQPFVENCVEHGIRNLSRKGTIDIQLVKGKNSIVCSIEDNGKGLNSPGGNEKKKRSLSTKISHKRFEILKKKFKTESGIELIDKIATQGTEGVKVVLTIPFKA